MNYIIAAAVAAVLFTPRLETYEKETEDEVFEIDADVTGIDVTDIEEHKKVLLSSFDVPAFSRFIANVARKSSSPLAVVNHSALRSEVRPGGSLFDRLFASEESVATLAAGGIIRVTLEHDGRQLAFRVRLKKTTTTTSTCVDNP